MKRLIILGAGGYGRTVADVAEQTGIYDSVLFLDDNAQGEKILGTCASFLEFANEDTKFYPAFGNNESRLAWIERIKAAHCSLPVIVHPDAYVSPKAQLDPGTVVLPKAVVNTGCRVETGGIVNCSAIVDHDCVLEPGVHICLGAIIKAENRIPRGMKIEAGEVVQNRTYPL